MVVEVVIGLVVMTALLVLWARKMQQGEDRQSKERLNLKLKLIELEKQINDERRRAESAEHDIRTGDSPIRRMFELLNRFEEPPMVFLNGQLLAPTIDYIQSDDGLRFMFNLKPRDIIQVRGTGEPLATVLSQNVREGDVVVITPTDAEDEESSMEQLRAAEQALRAEYPEPEPTTRYNRLMRDDEEGA